MTTTNIEWTDKTWNPVTGCTKVSPGCAHCYAEGVAERFWGKQYQSGYFDGSARKFEDVWTHADRLEQPLHWKKPARIFVNSMSDLFHEDVPDQFLHDVYHVMEQAHWHTFQVLTKRHARMHQYLSWRYGPREDGPGTRIPSRHIWHGVSVENQHWAENRIPFLLGTPSAVRFISAEPLLGPVDLSRWLMPSCCGNVTDGDYQNGEPPQCCSDPLPAVDWVIVGGESGPGARPFNVAWARSIVKQCQAAGVPVFVKQLGRDVITRNDDGWEGDNPRSWPMDTAYDEDLTGYRDGYQGAPVRVRLLSKKGGDPAEWPEDLRVREFPNVRVSA